MKVGLRKHVPLIVALAMPGRVLAQEAPPEEAAPSAEPAASERRKPASPQNRVSRSSTPGTVAPPPAVLAAEREREFGREVRPRSPAPSWIVEPDPAPAAAPLPLGYPTNPAVNLPTFPAESVNPMARLWGAFLVTVALGLGLLAIPGTRRVLLSLLGDRFATLGAVAGEPGIQLSADKNLGMGQRVVALEVDGRKVLLGLSQGKMEVLHTWEPEAPPQWRPTEPWDTPAVVRRSTSSRVPVPPPPSGSPPRRTSEAMRPVAPSPAERRAGQGTFYVEPRWVTQGRARVPTRSTASGAPMPDPGRRVAHEPRGGAPDSGPQLTPSAERLLDVWRQASMPPSTRQSVPASRPAPPPPPMQEQGPWWLDGATETDRQRLQRDPVLPPIPPSSEPDDIESELQDVLTIRRRGSSRAVL